MQATVTSLGALGTRATKKKPATKKRAPAKKRSTGSAAPKPESYVHSGETLIYNVDYDTGGWDTIGFSSPTADWIKGELAALQRFDDISVTRNNTNYLVDNLGHIRITLKSRIDRNSLIDIADDIIAIIKQRAKVLSNSNIDFVARSVSDGKIVDTRGGSNGNSNNNSYRGSTGGGNANNDPGGGGGSNGSSSSLLSYLGLGAVGVSSGAVLGLGVAVFLLIALKSK